MIESLQRILYEQFLYFFDEESIKKRDRFVSDINCYRDENDILCINIDLDENTIELIDNI